MANQQTHTKLSAGDIRLRKGGQRLSMVAAYDFPFARLAEQAGIELLLVGDSLGMTVLGYESTIPVTMDDMLHHCKAVVRGARSTHVVADLPFLSYHVSDAQALENAGRLMQVGGADSVKLEGGSPNLVQRVRTLVAAGIPVMAHIGLTPQTGGTQGYGTIGRDERSARRILTEATELADAGVHMMIVEAVPRELARIITATVPVPTIGIGSGPHCDGQIVVSTDMLGIETALFLNFAKRYANIGPVINAAFTAFREDVESGEFPAHEFSESMDPGVLEVLLDEDPLQH